MQPARHSCVFGLCPSARVDRKPVHFSADTFRCYCRQAYKKNWFAHPASKNLLCQSGADSLPPFLRPSSRQSHAPDGCSSLRPISAGVCAGVPVARLLSSFQHLVTAPDRPPRAQAVTGNGCPIARVDRQAVHFASDTGHEKQRFFFAFFPSESCHYVLAGF